MLQKVSSVLHVEDEVLDVQLIQRIFATHEVLNPLYRAKDGTEALEMLRGEKSHERLEPPYVILLDMKMPRMDGIEFLRELRADSQLQDTIVVMLTTFMGDEEQAQARRYAAAGILVKQDVAEDGSKLVNLLDEFWCVQPGSSEPAKVLQLARR